MLRLAVATAPVVLASDANPMDKVFELMDECAAKVKADGEAEAKSYKEYFDWCDDTAKNTQFEIKTHSSEKEELEATIGEETANIAASTTKIEELSAAIASDTAELKEATGIREKEQQILRKAKQNLSTRLTRSKGRLQFWNVKWQKRQDPLPKLTPAT